MEIHEFTTVNGFPVLYWEKRDAIIFSDLHLGLESLMVDAGVFMPKVQLEEILDEVHTIIDRVAPAEVIIVGDIKHEFSTASKGEKEEIRELLAALTESVDTVYVVKGNHDNFVIYALEHADAVRMDEYFILDDVCFIHGDSIPQDLAEEHFNTVVIGHEHPAVSVTDDAGVTEKIHCFLHGTWQNKDLIVLPAFSTMAEGAAVNTAPQDAFSSPFLREADMDSLRAVGVDREAGVLDFGSLTQLKQYT